MTWPFENDTSGIVKRISNRSISANRKRNIFIVLTIALASALLSAIVLYGFGVMQETQNRNQKTAQIMYHAISEQKSINIMPERFRKRNCLAISSTASILTFKNVFSTSFFLEIALPVFTSIAINASVG